MSQGVHESKGVSSDYLKLEALVQKVVSPYLGTHGLFSGDGSVSQSSCVLGERRHIPLLHQSSPVLVQSLVSNQFFLSTPKAPAPNQEKRFVSSTKTLLG